jgi:hypothetical protein
MSHTWICRLEAHLGILEVQVGIPLSISDGVRHGLAYFTPESDLSKGASLGEWHSRLCAAQTTSPPSGPHRRIPGERKASHLEPDRLLELSEKRQEFDLTASGDPFRIFVGFTP